MMKHKNKLISMSLATIVLVSMVAVVSLSASAAPTVKTAVGSAPAVTSTVATKYWIFVKGSDGKLYYTTDGKATGPPTVAWASLGTPSATVSIASDPTVAVNGANMYVFVKGSDGTIYEISTANGGGLWTSWSQVSTAQLATGTGPAAVVWTAGDARVVLFYVDSATNALQTTYQVGGAGFWSPVQNLAGYISSSPGAVNTAASGAMDVFVRGQSGALWQMEYATGAFGGWKEVPGNGYLAPGTGPTAVCYVTGTTTNIDVYVTGGSLGLWQQHYGLQTATATVPAWQTPATAGATGYTSLGGVLSSSPAATLDAVGGGAAGVFADGSGVNNIWWRTVTVAGGPPLAFTWTAWSGPVTSPS